MPEKRSSGNFVTNVLASLASDALLRWGLPVVIPFILIAYQKIRHIPVDWWGIVLLFVSSLGVAYLLSVYSRKRDKKLEEGFDTKLALHRAELEKKIPPGIMINGQRPGEAPVQRVDPSKDRIVDVFTPLQIEAFTIAKELRDFYSAFESYPADLQAKSGEGVQEFMARVFAEGLQEKRQRWQKELLYTYKNKGFGPRITALLHQVGKEYKYYPASSNFDFAEHLEPTTNTIPKLAQQMEMVAIGINRVMRSEVDLLHEKD